ncbi:MAG: hypothetical protein ACLP6E_12190, partial [Acidimicrobiales bacterium]
TADAGQTDECHQEDGKESPSSQASLNSSVLGYYRGTYIPGPTRIAATRGNCIDHMSIVGVRR